MTSPPAAKESARHRYIVVEGPIGVGKTSLATRLSESFGGDLILEQAEENPFLERFYRDNQGALPTQLFFLFQRARQLEGLRQDDLFAPVRVADYLLEKDRLFAQLNLDPQELNLYEEVAKTLNLDPPKPDLVIYLQAPVDVLLDRLHSRARSIEQAVDPEYLERLGEAYARFFYDFEDAPLLIVNAATFDPVHRQADFDELLAAVERIQRGRHYFNPLTANLA